jgi:hypothetical protein
MSREAPSGNRSPWQSLSVMKFTTHFLREAASDRHAHCLKCPRGDFPTLWEATRAAMNAADAAELRAGAFFITDETGKELARWQRTVSTWWKIAP